MVTAIYPGSFDPVTNGHVDVAERAARMFEHVIVAVYDTPSRDLLFNTQERVDMFVRAVTHLPNVEVEPYTGLTVEFALERGADVYVRGLRAGADFDYEFDMGLMNKKLAPEVEAVYLMTSLEYLFLSGSRIREVAALGRVVDDLVPPHVAEALKEKFGAGVEVRS